MRRKLVVLMLIGLLMAINIVTPVEAKKRKKKAKPVATTLFMEGQSTLGEEDQTVNGTYLKLQAEPGTGAKTMGMPNYLAGPNAACAGNGLVPVFVGSLAGKVIGDMKVTFDVLATPAAQAEVRVWPDIAAQACNEAYPEPAGAAVVDLPAGQGTVEAVVEDLKFDAGAVMMIQITPVLGGAPSYARVSYGTDASKVEFKCLPASGKSCI